MSPLATKLATALEAEPTQFHDLVDAYRAEAWRDFLTAWGELREAGILGRADDGCYYIGEPPSDTD
jgi:hypothetical protein